LLSRPCRYFALHDAAWSVDRVAVAHHVGPPCASGPEKHAAEPRLQSLQRSRGHALTKHVGNVAIAKNIRIVRAVIGRECGDGEEKCEEHRRAFHPRWLATPPHSYSAGSGTTVCRCR